MIAGVIRQPIELSWRVVMASRSLSAGLALVHGCDLARTSPMDWEDIDVDCPSLTAAEGVAEIEKIHRRQTTTHETDTVRPLLQVKLPHSVRMQCYGPPNDSLIASIRRLRAAGSKQRRVAGQTADER